MYLEKAKLEEFEIYYQMKCEKYIAYWSQGNYEIPPRENLYRFYTGCLQSAEGEQCKEIYLIKTDEGETAGYLYMDYLENSVDIPIALCERFTKKGLAKQAISEGLRMARERDTANRKLKSGRIMRLLSGYTLPAVITEERKHGRYIPPLSNSPSPCMRIRRKSRMRDNGTGK